MPLPSATTMIYESDNNEKSQLLLRLDHLSASPDLFWAQVIMQSFPLFDSLYNMLHFIDPYFEAILPATKAKYLHSISNCLLTFGTHHGLPLFVLLKA